MKYQILSPDGISIENIPGYPTFEAAKNAFEVWKERFKNQGYYSSNEGRAMRVKPRFWFLLTNLNPYPL